jgi:hypothetical protein
VKIVAKLQISFLFAALPAQMLACSCLPVLGFCERLPDTSDQTRVVFVGAVREFYPKSRAQMNEIFDEFYRTHQELIPHKFDAGPRSARHLPGDAAANLDFRKQFIGYLWGDALTPAEREKLSFANERDLDGLMFDYRRRVRFDVAENFAGADSPTFELYTSLDGPSCGFDFVEGETYLVEAYRSPGQDRWLTGSCSRTRALAQASEELRVLRAWKSGLRLPGRIQGHTDAGVRVTLLGDRQTLETATDSNGRFEFANLEAGNYEVQAAGAIPRHRTVDLIHAWCAQVFLH